MPKTLALTAFLAFSLASCATVQILGTSPAPTTAAQLARALNALNEGSARGVADNDRPLVGTYNGGEFVMKSGAITGNANTNGSGGGVEVSDDGTFTMEGGAISGNTGRFQGGVAVKGIFTLKGGRIQGSEDSDGFAGNTATGERGIADAIGSADSGGGTVVMKWGTGGTYTKGGVPQTSGSNIVTGRGSDWGTSDTLIAIPAS